MRDGDVATLIFGLLQAGGHLLELQQSFDGENTSVVEIIVNLTSASSEGSNGVSKNLGVDDLVTEVFVADVFSQLKRRK